MCAINFRAKGFCVIYSVVYVETDKIIYRTLFVFSAVVCEIMDVLRELLTSIYSHCFVHLLTTAVTQHTVHMEIQV